MNNSPKAPAGIYPDPDDPTKTKYWDGENWTEPPTPIKKSKKPIWIAIAAVLAIGTVIGTVAIINNAETQRIEEEKAAAEKARLETFSIVKDRCGITSTYAYIIQDGGESLALTTDFDYRKGVAEWIDSGDVKCVLDKLEAPSSVWSKVGTTRALDGRQSADWGGYTASWTYHPDDGLNMLIEHVVNPTSN